VAEEGQAATGEITILLRQWEAGNEAALGPLLERIYPRLKEVAGALCRGERAGSLMQATGLVNEFYVRLLEQRELRFENRSHFLSLAARLMRWILVDQARREGAAKRGAGAKVRLHEDLAWVEAGGEQMVDLNRALEELEALDARKCRLVELRYMLGLTAEEAAEVAGVSKATVDRELRFARSWLYARLQERGAE
jgi:RNA polymerase sigma factor (TIGR02999 family)